MKDILQKLMQNDGFVCPKCGKRHFGKLADCIIGDAALQMLPALIQKYHGTRVFVLCDENTYAAAGNDVCQLLDAASIPYTLHKILRPQPAPDERIVGEAMMYCDLACDLIIAVGGGVINDACKMLAAAKDIPQITVATAPSMDGFASATSSMERSGLKVSLNSKCPCAVIGDSAVLAAAPVHMIRAGIGDMLAKYISLTEWKIAHILLGESYCPLVAELVQRALDTCIEVGQAAVHGDKEACADVMRGLVLGGMAMNYVGMSRPASGMEHYISHILDMRALEFGTPSDLHGIQCGIATLYAVRAYEALPRERPDKQHALDAVSAFSLDAWFAHLREMLGHGAEAIIAGEEKEHKYDREKHAARLECILDKWDDIYAVIDALPSAETLETFLREIGHPTSGQEMGLTDTDMHEAFLMAKDIRDKYVLGRLLWDLGMLS